ncbi:MAG: mechanosensitive ion channel [Bacteroidales bacterium]|nr:mechanosensitive ion channel [Bacteroidales bacterium]MBQ9723009.1 mechanosensitive ion channel [Bacteroidales bacterium]
MGRIMFLQTPVTDTLTIESKVTEVIETMKNTPAEVLLSDFVDKALSFGLKVLAAILIYIIGAWLIRKIKKILASIFERRKTDAAIASFVNSMTSIALTVMLIVITVGTLGIDTTSLAALLAGGGVAIGMALNGTVQNFAGGIMLLIFKPFKAGDYIQAQGFEGTVTEVTIVSTKLTTVDNRNIIIPNGILSNDTINNFSQNTMRRVDWSIDVEYGSSSEQTKELLMTFLSGDERILTAETGAPADPFVALSALKDSGVQFTMKAWVKKENYWDVNYDILEKIYNELPKHDIKFPFPQLDVNIKQDS